MLDGSFAVGSVTAGAGWRVNPWLAVGASLSYNYMRITIKRKLSIIAALTPEGQQPSGDAVLGQKGIGDITMDYTGVDHGVGWGASVLLTPLSWLSIGITYQGATDPRFDGDVSLTSRDTKTMQDIFLLLSYKMPERLRVEMPYPHTVGVGFSVAPSPRVEIGVDLRMWLYQVYELQKVTPIYDPAEPGNEPLTEEGLSQDKNYNMRWRGAGATLAGPGADGWRLIRQIADPRRDLHHGQPLAGQHQPGRRRALGRQRALARLPELHVLHLPRTQHRGQPDLTALQRQGLWCGLSACLRGAAHLLTPGLDRGCRVD
jgi:hypothetical protein